MHWNEYGLSLLSLPHTRKTCWANRLAWRLPQLCIFTAYVGITTQHQSTSLTSSFAFCISLAFPWRHWGSHWLLNSSSSALSSQHPQTLRIFPRQVKNIKHDIDIFLKALTRSIRTKTIRTREKHHTRRSADSTQQVSLVCGQALRNYCTCRHFMYSPKQTFLLFYSTLIRMDTSHSTLCCSFCFAWNKLYFH
jgi:hypothetical protein